MVLKTFVFLDEISTGTTSNDLIIGNGKFLTVEVAPVVEGEAVSVTFEGKIDSESDVYYDLAAKYGATGQYAASAVNAGLYFLDVTGVGVVHVVSTGTAGDTTVIGRLSN